MAGKRRTTRRPPRLSPEDAALWAALTRGVTPLAPGEPPGVTDIAAGVAAGAPAATKSVAKPPPAPPRAMPARPTPPSTPPPCLHRSFGEGGLDGSWERRLARGLVSPDITLDLHGASLAVAHARLEAGLAQALAQGARLVLLITGRPRALPTPADRASTRGAIRASVNDWLAHGPHRAKIAAVRGAHPRHGGPGALYIVLRAPP